MNCNNNSIRHIPLSNDDRLAKRHLIKAPWNDTHLLFFTVHVRHVKDQHSSLLMDKHHSRLALAHFHWYSFGTKFKPVPWTIDIIFLHLKMYINQRVKAQFHQDQIADLQTQSQRMRRKNIWPSTSESDSVVARIFNKAHSNTQNLREITRFDLKALELPHDLSIWCIGAPCGVSGTLRGHYLTSTCSRWLSHTFHLQCTFLFCSLLFTATTLSVECDRYSSHINSHAL